MLVSEFMLQQTQVDRVRSKYLAFVARFPNFESLAGARMSDVLRLWQGLGYNSRAVRLKQLAQSVVERFDGTLPADAAALQSLPGVGPYTLAAIRAFAFDLDDAAIDTNVRRVMHRLLHGLEYPPAVSAPQLDADAHALVPHGRAHDWNSALMDLGSTICTARAPKCLLCPLLAACAAAPIDSAALDRERVKHAKPRSPQEAIPFARTTRYARGRIIDRLRELPPGKRISLLALHGEIGSNLERTQEDLDALVAALARDGLVRIEDQEVALQD